MIKILHEDKIKCEEGFVPAMKNANSHQNYYKNVYYCTVIFKHKEEFVPMAGFS